MPISKLIIKRRVSKGGAYGEIGITLT